MSRWMRFLQPIVAKIQWRPTRPLLGKIGAVLGVALVGGVAFGLGRWMGLGSATAQGTTPTLSPRPLSSGIVNADLYPGDYSGRVVAYVKGNIPVTRVELAEYLIDRFGAERLEFLVNRKIVEMACQAKGIYVTDVEVENQFRADMQAISPTMTPKLFQDQILSKYNKKIFEWKEDVIRPKLALSKLVRPEVKVDDADIQKGFEIRFGPKVQCKLVVYQDKTKAAQGWDKIRASANVEAAFLEEVRNCYIPDISREGGKIPGIHKHFPNLQIEKEAFSMKAGDISPVIGMPDNTAIILFCEGHLPANSAKRLEDERPALSREIFEMKLAQQIQEKVVTLRREATPKLILARQPNIDEIRRDVEAEITPVAGSSPLGSSPVFQNAGKK